MADISRDNSTIAIRNPTADPYSKDKPGLGIMPGSGWLLGVKKA
jgi:hypothetical protein